MRRRLVLICCVFCFDPFFSPHFFKPGGFTMAFFAATSWGDPWISHQATALLAGLREERWSPSTDTGQCGRFQGWRLLWGPWPRRHVRAPETSPRCLKRSFIHSLPMLSMFTGTRDNYLNRAMGMLRIKPQVGWWFKLFFLLLLQKLKPLTLLLFVGKMHCIQ